jgi:hypothetical protein
MIKLTDKLKKLGAETTIEDLRKATADVADAQGVYAIICTRGIRQNRCKYCGRIGTKLCDFKLTAANAGKTCDAPMCARCASHREPDTDYCKPHAAIVDA